MTSVSSFGVTIAYEPHRENVFTTVDVVPCGGRKTYAL